MQEVALFGTEIVFCDAKEFCLAFSLSICSSAGSRHCEMTVGVVHSLAFTQFYHLSYLAAAFCPCHTDGLLCWGTMNTVGIGPNGLLTFH